MKNRMLSWLIAACVLILGACSSSSDENDEPESSGLQFNAVGDFESSASALLGLIKRVTTGTCDDIGGAPTDMDDPILEDGSDCDEDGGIVAHITPNRYAIAFKRATLVPDEPEGEDVNLIADAGTLAASEVVDFTEDDSTESIISIDSADLPEGTYTGVEVEMYFFQLTFTVAGVEQNVRIYMSDDDFDTEGNLGHHQGDITFIDDNDSPGDYADDTELGWVDSTWLSENLTQNRGEAQNGAGDVDDETGHDRGFFGDGTLWNQEDLDQGANADIYITTLDFDEPVTIDPEVLTTITATFSIADTFYYEDFEPQNTEEFPGFYPDEGGEAGGVVVDSPEWAPLTPSAEITAEAT